MVAHKLSRTIRAANARQKTERDEAAGTALDRLVTAAQALAEADGLRAENARLKSLLKEALTVVEYAQNVARLFLEQGRMNAATDLLAKLKAET